MDKAGMLDMRCCVNGPQEAVWANASSHAAQLRSLVVLLHIPEYRKWGFRVMGVPSGKCISSVYRLVYLLNAAIGLIRKEIP